MAGARESVEEVRSLWSAEDLAAYLKLRNVNTVGNMVRSGRVTKADGLVKVGRMTRFHRQIVIDRIDAGLFGKGLDAEGNPVMRNGNGKP